MFVDFLLLIFISIFNIATPFPPTPYPLYHLKTKLHFLKMNFIWEEGGNMQISKSLSDSA
jgi:hypothetical protein